MKAAIVNEAGKPPVYGDFPDPVPADGRSVLRVTAAPITHLTRARASGGHYSVSDAFPLVPGADGAGIAEDGRHFYFLIPEPPYGAMAEYVLVRDDHLIPIPDSLDDFTAAALANPGMASWTALVGRAGLRPGETVLINGATGASGRLAIQIARHLGAGRVIATGRRVEAFDDLRRLGADAIIQLEQDREALGRALLAEFRRGVDIVLDYLWGPSAEALLAAAATGGEAAVPIRFVQVGSMSAADISLPSALLRSSALEIIGSGLGSVRLDALKNAISGVFGAARDAKLEIATERVPLAEVARAWAERSGGARLVVVPDDDRAPRRAPISIRT